MKIDLVQMKSLSLTTEPLDWTYRQPVLTYLCTQRLLDHCIVEEGQVTDYNYKVRVVKVHYELYHRCLIINVF